MIASGGGSNLFPPEQLAHFTEAEISARIYGSKLVLISEQAMLCTIWGVKACMLIFYGKLTSGLPIRRWVKVLGVYVAVGWVACELAIFLQCRPFHGYWGMPPPKGTTLPAPSAKFMFLTHKTPAEDCTTFKTYAIINALFNISSDVIMLSIPLPMLFKSRLPFKQKAAVLSIFAMGLFVIIAAILTKIFNLADIYSTVYMFWYIRESSVAVYVSNLPQIWPLLRKCIPGMRATGETRFGPCVEGDYEGSDMEMSGKLGKRGGKRTRDQTLWEDENGSTEGLAAETVTVGTGTPTGSTEGGPGEIVAMGGIRQEVTFKVEHGERGAWKGEKAGVFEGNEEGTRYRVAVRGMGEMGKAT